MLDKLSTRHLLKLLEQCRKFNGRMDITDNHSGYWITIEDIKAILATREHVPNKQEAKLLRQKKMKDKRNR